MSSIFTQTGGEIPSSPVKVVPNAPSQDDGMPGMIQGLVQSGTDINKYEIRYAKVDLDDIGGRTEVEIIKTRSLRGDGIILLSEDKFTFMDKYFLIIQYLEEKR